MYETVFANLCMVKKGALKRLSAELAAPEKVLTKFHWRMDARPCGAEASRKLRRSEMDDARWDPSSGEKPGEADDMDDDLDLSDGAMEGAEGFTQNELDLWMETSEGDKREAAAALAELGGMSRPLAVIKTMLFAIVNPVHKRHEG